MPSSNYYYELGNNRTYFITLPNAICPLFYRLFMYIDMISKKIVDAST